MRGGTSKGGYFLKSDLPDNTIERDALLLRVMGSPDPRQIDGMGGADPLTSKVAVVSPSTRKGVDVDYLFLQVAVDTASVSDAQNCGNILAGVGPFAIERGLISPVEDTTRVRVYMENTGQIAIASINTPGGTVTYDGDASIDGVPGNAAPVQLQFEDTAGSSCGALLPSGNARDTVNGIDITMIDTGMPCVLLRARDVGIEGTESREALDANTALRETVEALRLAVGERMNLGDVREKTVPKMTIISPPRHGGTITTRTFIPHRCHASIGVLGAVSVASACLLPGSVADGIASVGSEDALTLDIEHPGGKTPIAATRDGADLGPIAVLRTARRLMDGLIYR